MHLDIEIPTTVPLMTLPDTVFFPQAILPLYIFEPRYRQMLSDALESDRLFALAREDPHTEGVHPMEPPEPVATIGVIRAANQHADGTSNLVLQGICRVRVLAIESTEPYPLVRVQPMLTAPVEDPAAVMKMKHEVSELLQSERYLANEVPIEFMEFLTSLDDPDTFIDLTAFAVCPSARVKQRILETLPLEERYRAFLDYLGGRRSEVQLHKRLQGGIHDADIELN